MSGEGARIAIGSSRRGRWSLCGCPRVARVALACRGIVRGVPAWAYAAVCVMRLCIVSARCDLGVGVIGVVGHFWRGWALLVWFGALVTFGAPSIGSFTPEAVVTP